ncbi:MAG: hypothetical protein CMJ35_03675 [Phycisphaerae bacterium]|nr:hypothetical protein [Phycisphaerae bacterium]MBM90698.1 hypothetical protein [Phycisphaerae bacterium]HCT45404.1 hypothetical protein [Phycisphaerales bacterium]|tara:strand:- start:524 stop:745 length:222 start_codon:yes stop_codon:yes gene_type:complete
MNDQLKLRQIRHSKGFTQELLAERVGVSAQTIHRFETGRSSPKLSDLVKISRVLGIRLVDLLPVEPSKQPAAA